MTISILLTILTIVCAIGSLYTCIQVANDLRARGLPAHPFLVRWMIFKYMADYRRVTLQETGTVGPLYNRCATISALTALFAIAAILSHVS